ncbi:hypothetical protein [Halomarina oriensis]|uniref:DUF4177 domain-containing protein n=1 Tax=Halomarina oriensis TaxID=671145 RepID=A0A6B0GSB4_9EURY|nr:hypothetical protein [Halomarina oriensis]MWG36589.1 hypothetical protein [Halomarina oriensis]
MSEQRFEYETFEIPRGQLASYADALNEKAANGWQVKYPLMNGGAIQGFLLERPV